MSKAIDLVDDLKRAIHERDKEHPSVTTRYHHKLKVFQLKNKLIKQILEEELD